MKQENKPRFSLNALTGAVVKDSDMFSLRHKCSDGATYYSPKYSSQTRLPLKPFIEEGKSQPDLFRHKGVTNPEFDVELPVKYYLSPIGGESKREEDILKYMDLVKQAAYKVPKNSTGILDHRDLMQIGMIALIEAYNTMDHSRPDSDKRGYLRLCITQKMRLNVSFLGNTMRVSESQLNKNIKNNESDPYLRGKTYKLDNLMYVDNEKETISDSVVGGLDPKEKKYPIHYILNKLEPAEQEVITLNFGLHTPGKMTLEEVAEEMNISVITAKRIKSKALGKASKMLGGVRKATDVEQVSWMDSNQIVIICHKAHNALYSGDGLTKNAIHLMREREVNTLEDLLVSWEMTGEGYWFEDRVKLFKAMSVIPDVSFYIKNQTPRQITMPNKEWHKLNKIHE